MPDFDPATYGQIAGLSQFQGSGFTFFSAAAANGISPQFQAYGYEDFTYFITASGVTTGATVKIQAQTPDQTWVDIDSRVVGGNGSQIVKDAGVYAAIRATISSRTDGTFAVTVIAR